MLEVQRLEARYGAIQVLWSVSLQVAEGEIVTLLGGNGAGKSTTIKAVSSIVPAAGGEVAFAGDRIEGWPPHRVVEAGLIQIPEGRQIWGELSVRDNLEMGAFSRRARDGRERRSPGCSRSFPCWPSGRGCQRGRSAAASSRCWPSAAALMARPRLLMLDEPSLGLAPQWSSRSSRPWPASTSEGMTILLVEQNVASALRIADRAYVIENGRITREGASEALRASDEIRASYLGL